MADHVAIMTKAWKLIPKILAGQKTIESRWYQTRRVPWNSIKAGDTVYFKNSGEKVTAKARVDKVRQLELKSIVDAKKIVAKYGRAIAIVNPDPAKWGKLPKYCILIWLKDPKPIAKPFDIDKKGFGNAAAWLCVSNIKRISLGC